MPKADISESEGWYSPQYLKNPGLLSGDPKLYARTLTKAPIVETTHNVTRVSLELSDRVAVAGTGQRYPGGRSPGGTVVCVRALGELVKHLVAGDSIALQPLELYRMPEPWKNVRDYQKRIDCQVVYWMSRSPP
jgi:hypothetical protein